MGAAQMFGTRGVEATSIRELAKFSETPLGSIYHYFPGGKTELIAATIQWMDDGVKAILDQGRAHGAPAAFDAFIETWTHYLANTNYRASCPVLAGALEDVRADDVVISSAASTAFRSWKDLIAAMLREEGVAEERADALAWLVLSTIEGAVSLCRTQRSPTPLNAAARELRELIVGVLAVSPAGPVSPVRPAGPVSPVGD